MINESIRQFAKVATSFIKKDIIRSVVAAIQNVLKSSPNMYSDSKSDATVWLNELVRTFKENEEENSAKDYMLKYPGNFYLFSYTSKLYEQGRLKHYDALPLVLVLKLDSTGFLGLNFHWIHPKYRAFILQRIIKYYAKKFFNDDFLRPINAKILQRLVTPVGKKYIGYAVRRYNFENLNKIKGLKYIRIKNKEMPKAILYTSPKFINISVTAANMLTRNMK